MKLGQYHYYVEGENERVLVEILSKCKDEKFNVIRPGKIDVFNVVEREIKSTHMLNLKDNTVVVLVFDTDTKSRAILDKNTKFLEKHKKIKDVINTRNQQSAALHKKTDNETRIKHTDTYRSHIN